MNAKIMLDDKHVASATMHDRDIDISVNHFPKLLSSPRFVKFALSVKSITDAEQAALQSGTAQTGSESGQEPRKINFDTSFIKGIFGR